MKYKLHKQSNLNKCVKGVFVYLLVVLTLVNVSYAGIGDPAKAAESKSTASTSRDNVTGTVTDAKGESLPGVTVKIKGTSTATITDVNGVFRINLPTGNETLVFSFIGFKTQEIAVKGQTSFDVKLQEDVNSLETVIVTGYGGTTTKGASTGAIDNLDAKEIEDLPLGNLGAALAGRMLGLSVSGGTSRPGSTAQLTIRNPMSLAKDGGNNEPLYIIDDVIQVTGDGRPDNTLFNNLDPSEVENITILKDAAAAIYGSRAANGAVIVKTKRGKLGKPRVSYSGSFAVNDEAYRTKMLSAYEFAQYMNIRNGANGSGRAISSTDAKYSFTSAELEKLKGVNYDWLDNAWSAASNMRHTFNVSGGAEKATYFANVSYYTQDGNLSSLDFNKWTFRAGTDVDLLSGLKAGLQIGGNYDKLSTTFNKIGGEKDENDYTNLLRAPRYIPMYYDGMAVKLPGTDQYSRYHFYEVERLGNLKGNEDQITTVNVYAEYALPFVKGLKARASYARNMSSGRGSQLGTKYRLYEFDNAHVFENLTPSRSKEWENGNRLYYSNRHGLSTQFNLSTNYDRQFGQHSLSAFFTVEKAEANTSQEDVLRENPSLSSNGQLGTAFGDYSGKSAGNESGSLGYIGRVNYNFASKYLADFVFRSDASTKFSPDNYWGKFYSLGMGWVISEENFFKIPAVDFLKLRYTVGLLGKDDTKAWQWRQRYTFQGDKGAVFGDDGNAVSIGMKMEASPNPDATWSDEFKQNLGLDARFLDSRLSATVEAFYNKGSNMLIERTAGVPITVGGTVAAENWAKIDFFGTEFGLGWNDNIGRDFRYGIDTRFSWYDNKVKQSNFNESDFFYPWNPQPGQSSDNGQWGYDNLGMFKNQADIDAYVQQYNIKEMFEEKPEDFKPGMLYYRDVRGPLQPDGTFAAPDGIIDDNDQIQLSKKASNHYGFGMTLRAGYKGFNIDAVIAGSFGGWSEIDARKPMNQDISRIYQSVPSYWNNIYDPELNPGGKYPNPNWENVSLNPASAFWQVSSFRMRMRNFNINYTLPKKISERIGVSNARVFFTGVNPINFYNPYDYKDSEGGWDVFPTLRTYSLGVNLSL